MPTLLREPSLKGRSAENTRFPLVIDLCSGMGGISLAATQLKMKIIAGIDTDPAASLTFAKNFPAATAFLGSVRSKVLLQKCKILLEEQRVSDQPTLVVSGPPCQGFSDAGSRDPRDPRNQILLAVARSIVALQPNCAIIENVSRVLDSKHAARIRQLISILNRGEYHVCEVLLDAAEFGVPQRRKRAFFFATKNRVSRDSIDEALSQLRIPSITVSDAISDLPRPEPRPTRYVDADEKGPLFNHYAMLHSKKVKTKIAAIPQGSGPMSYRKLHPKQLSNTLISGNRAPPAHYSQARSITVREALRLQGFPDAFRVFGPFGNQMRQVTNAVPPPLAKAALKVLCKMTGMEI